MKITVLGAGRVGSAIVRDLAGEFTVTAADASEAALARLAGLAKVKTVRADLGLQSQRRPHIRGLAVSGQFAGRRFVGPLSCNKGSEDQNDWRGRKTLFLV